MNELFLHLHNPAAFLVEMSSSSNTLDKHQLPGIYLQVSCD